MIPEMAVEAAASAIYATTYTDAPHDPSDYLEQARAILEAAAPHLMAEAWDEGMLHGSRAPGRLLDKWDENPYRRDTK